MWLGSDLKIGGGSPWGTGAHSAQKKKSKGFVQAKIDALQDQRLGLEYGFNQSLELGLEFVGRRF